MKAAVVDFHQYFEPVLGTAPWRVKLGVGSFLTFEFGPRVKSDGHVHGHWHLWVYMSTWSLFHGKRQLVDSDEDRKLIAISARRIEGEVLTNIDFNAHTKKTTFSFGDFRLAVSPADYLDNPEERDDYWIFFMPDNKTLAVGPSGIRLEQGAVPHSSVSRKKHDGEMRGADVRKQIRQITFED